MFGLSYFGFTSLYFISFYYVSFPSFGSPFRLGCFFDFPFVLFVSFFVLFLSLFLFVFLFCVLLSRHEKIRVLYVRKKFGVTAR